MQYFTTEIETTEKNYLDSVVFFSVVSISVVIFLATRVVDAMILRRFVGFFYLW